MQNFLELLFLKSSSGCFWGFSSCFQRNSEQKPVQLSAIDTRFSWKKKSICCRENPEAASRCPLDMSSRCSLEEGLQGPAQVFFCECCEIFKSTYFEKHLRTAASQNQHFRGKFTKGRIPEFYYPFKIF